jgi:hypothetical protein
VKKNVSCLLDLGCCLLDVVSWIWWVVCCLWDNTQRTTHNTQQTTTGFQFDKFALMLYRTTIAKSINYYGG